MDMIIIWKKDSVSLLSCEGIEFYQNRRGLILDIMSHQFYYVFYIISYFLALVSKNCTFFLQ